MSFLEELDSLEYPINRAIQNFDGTLFDTFFRAVSNISLMLSVFGVIICILILKKHKLWKPLLFSLIISGVTSYLINEGILKMLLSHF